MSKRLKKRKKKLCYHGWNIDELWQLKDDKYEYKRLYCIEDTYIYCIGAPSLYEVERPMPPRMKRNKHNIFIRWETMLSNTSQLKKATKDFIEEVGYIFKKNDFKELE